MWSKLQHVHCFPSSGRLIPALAADCVRRDVLCRITQHLINHALCGNIRKCAASVDVMLGCSNELYTGGGIFDCASWETTLCIPAVDAAQTDPKARDRQSALPAC